MNVRCTLLDTGYCTASEHHLMQGGRRTRVECHSIVALLEHPQHGWLLWDAGYAPRLWDATRGWPFRLYRWGTPLHITAELSVAAQLPRLGLTSGDIRIVLISHFHADHIAGLRDFPNARFVVQRAAYADVAGRRGLRALQRAFIPALLPDDFVQRATLLDPFTGPSLPGLGVTHDCFDDGTLLLVALPGHARGQMGLLAHTDRGRLLFAADAAWHSRAIREQRPPAAVTHFIVDDAQALVTTLQSLHTFAQECPDVRLIPTHCPEVFAEWEKSAKSNE